MFQNPGKRHTHHQLPQLLVIRVEADKVELLLHTETLQTQTQTLSLDTLSPLKNRTAASIPAPAHAPSYVEKDRRISSQSLCDITQIPELINWPTGFTPATLLETLVVFDRTGDKKSVLLSLLLS